MENKPLRRGMQIKLPNSDKIAGELPQDYDNEEFIKMLARNFGPKYGQLESSRIRVENNVIVIENPTDTRNG